MGRDVNRYKRRLGFKNMLSYFLFLVVILFSVQFHWTVNRVSAHGQDNMFDLAQLHDFDSFSDKILNIHYEQEDVSWKSRYQTLETQSQQMRQFRASGKPRVAAGVDGSYTRYPLSSKPTAALLRRGAFLALGACSAGEAQLCRSAVEFPVDPADDASQEGVGHSISRELEIAVAQALSVTINGTHGGLREVNRAYAVHLDDNILRKCQFNFASAPSLSVQLRAFADRVIAHGPERRVAYTVADQQYQGGLADIALNYKRACGINFFLCVALDESTAVQACALGLNSVRYGKDALSKPPVGDRMKKQQVYGAKYGVLAVLLDLGLDVTFGEMDVWLLGDPIRGTPIRDVAIGVHQDNPYNINAGWIHAQRPRQPSITSPILALSHGTMGCS